jgi:5-methylcytosine-specific restriction endonuclease McrBC regulatory subunit McrC
VRTITLTERHCTECPLGGPVIDFLLSAHGTHLRIVPTRHRSLFRVTPTRFVGVIAAPGCRLLIRPKVSLRALFHLLDPRTELDADTEPCSGEPGVEVLWFLARRLVALLAERVAAGLHRAYAEKAGEGPFLQGRLDVAAQLREGAGRRDVFHCRRDDFTPDVPCNQVPRATLELLLRSGLVEEPLATELSQSLRSLEGIASTVLTPEVFSRAAADRTAASYRPLLDLCRLVAEGLHPAANSGSTPGPTFLLDLERVFERYVTRGVTEAFAGDQRRVVEQARHTASEPVAGQTAIELCPDVTIWQGEQVCCVVDAKWKQLPPEGRLTSDVYQVLAYCAGLGTRRAVLVYPGRRDGCRTYRLPQTGIRVEVRTLRVTASAEACRRSLRRLGRGIRR